MTYRVLAAATAAAALAWAGAAFTQGPPQTADQIAREAHRIAMQFRTGRYELGPQAIALLEPAVVTYPDDVRLWNALGMAYFQQVTGAFHAGRVAEIPGLIQKAQGAHERALALDPRSPEGLSGQAMAFAMMGSAIRNPAMMTRGVGLFEQAAAVGPNVTRVHLQRGFGGVNLPAEHRNSEAVESDLNWLIKRGSPRERDVLNLLVGDLQAEMGKPDAARASYTAAATRAGSTQRQAAEARLDALARGPIPAGDVAKLRGELGRNCVICHGE